MKWVVLTGDSGGLGAIVLAALLEKSNYGVIGLSRRYGSLQQELHQAYSDRYVHLPCDLLDSATLGTVYREKIRAIGPIYGCVNNAGTAYDDLATNARFDELEAMFRVNVYAPILLTKYCIRDMLLHETEGSIVHITSISAHKGYKGLSMYAATKGALEAFSRGVAREWGQRGIRSNCVAPGFIETDMNRDLPDRQKERIFARNALGRPTSAESVAEAVCFLLSDAAESITGTTVHVDGGAA